MLRLGSTVSKFIRHTVVFKWKDQYNYIASKNWFCIYLVSLFFIYTEIECTNTAFLWTCPGGYLQVQSALWIYFKIDECIQTTSGSDPPTNVIKNVQNECENKTSCNFNVTDFGVSCAGCSALIYVYIS